MSGPASHLQHLQLLCQVAGLGWAGWAGLEPACSIRCDSIIVMAAAASRKRIVLRFSEYVVSGAGLRAGCRVSVQTFHCFAL